MEIYPEPYAVDLSNDGIFLWHRKPAKKWEFLGSVPLNSGNLREQLEALKATAMNIDAPSYNAIARIPTAEVMTLSVAFEPDANWETRVVAALEDASGVPVEDLVFDIERGDGTSDINIAWTSSAVIKQAESFVRLIGFIPTRYTTDLDTSVFPRNPSFYMEGNSASTQNAAEAIKTEQEEQSPNTDIIDYAPKLAMTEIPQNGSQNPYVKHQKGDFEFVWFIALFLILAILIAIIYFWPTLKQKTEPAAQYEIDQPFFAVAPELPVIHFEVSKMTL